MSGQSPTPIFDLGKALAKTEATKVAPAPKDTTIAFDVGVAGKVKTFGVEVEHTHVGEQFVWSAAGWFKQALEPGGRSAGVKGKLAF